MWFAIVRARLWEGNGQAGMKWSQGDGRDDGSNGWLENKASKKASNKASNNKASLDLKLVVVVACGAWSVEHGAWSVERGARSVEWGSA
ncbi:hypothetical protein E4U43_008571 [Claviceps pusilla]|uniref:Uncharacterized protein n=1 Tax=Claviceps pusilla TaxID=123648 RepID=A0A9P7NAG0_9HYPO|nr:hypothetical protein E4U43_008571 [Claviceps pusilla]